MDYKKYQHIEKLGREECEGVLDSDSVYCFPKIDGTNSCLFLDDCGNLQAGSRNRQLTLEKDNAGFYADALQHSEYKEYLEEHPNHILYGEWLIIHTIKTYSDDAWRKFYVFDVFEVNSDEDSSKYLSYNEYTPELDRFNIRYIPVMAVLDHPSKEDIVELAKKNHYLIPDEKNIGEGIVVKSYDYRNKYGRQIWGKFVAEEFFGAKEKLRSKNHAVKSDFEMKVAEEYVTDAVIKKEYAKIKNDFPDAKRGELIGRVLNAVYEAFLIEDLTTVVRKNNGCTINFKYMRKQCDNRVKEVLKDELF
jgi:hypothetical protein